MQSVLSSCLQTNKQINIHTPPIRCPKVRGKGYGRALWKLRRHSQVKEEGRKRGKKYNQTQALSPQRNFLSSFLKTKNSATHQADQTCQINSRDSFIPRTICNNNLIPNWFFSYHPIVFSPKNLFPQSALMCLSNQSNFSFTRVFSVKSSMFMLTENTRIYRNPDTIATKMTISAMTATLGYLYNSSTPRC